MKKWTRFAETVSDGEIEFIGNYPLVKSEDKQVASETKTSAKTVKVEKCEDDVFYRRLLSDLDNSEREFLNLKVDKYLLRKIISECCSCKAKEIVKEIFKD